MMFPNALHELLEKMKQVPESEKGRIQSEIASKIGSAPRYSSKESIEVWQREMLDLWRIKLDQAIAAGAVPERKESR